MTSALKCTRCDRPMKKAARRVSGRPVCASCAPYFSTWVTCSGCDKATLEARAQFVDGELMCISCVPKPNSSPRPSNVAHACPECGTSVSGGGSKLCRRCYALHTARALAELQRARLENVWARNLWDCFIAWLMRSVDVLRGYRSIFPSGDAFVEFDVRFSGLNELKADSLLSIGGPEWIRRHVHVAQFLAQAEIVAPTRQQKLAWSEDSKIERIVEGVSDAHRPILTRYIQHCNSTKQPLAPRTMCVYIRAAASFLGSTRSPIDHIDSKAVERFLNKHRGHRASLFRFVTFLKRSGIAPSASMPKLMRRYRAGYTDSIVDRIKAYEYEYFHTTSLARKRALAAATLAVSLGLALEHCVRVRRSHVELRQDACLVKINGVQHVANGIAAPMIKELCRGLCQEDLLFPGRVPGESLTVAGLSYHTKIATRAT